MDRRVRWKSHARCGVGENSEIKSKDYLSLFAITRAIKNLYVFSPKTIRGKFSDVSRFILESGLEEESNNVDYGIKKGDIVYHRQYGDAKVKNIKADKITLDFKDGISRSFSLRVLMENNLIILIK